MDKYLKQKLPPVDRQEEFSKKQADYQEKLKQLRNSPVAVVPDLQQPVAKDLPVERIDKLQAKAITSPNDVMEKIAASRASKDMSRSMPGDTLDYSKFKPNVMAQELPEKILPSGDWKKEYAAKAKLDKLKSLRGVLKAIPGIGPLTQITPSLVDLKEGNPNTAAARMITGLAPAGTGELDAQLMQQAHLQDNAPELQDPNYLRTLQAIGQRRQGMGKSPVVESFSGQPVDTSATEDSDFLNKIIAAQRAKTQG